MSGILASMIDGLLIGSVYGLAAMGLSLIWGVMDVINLTHGAMIALGMFGMYLLFGASAANPYLLLIPVIAAGLVLGMIVYWLSVSWVIDRPQLMSLLSTFAVNMMVIGIGTAIWSTSPYNVNFSLPGMVQENWPPYCPVKVSLVAVPPVSTVWPLVSVASGETWRTRRVAP